MHPRVEKVKEALIRLGVSEPIREIEDSTRTAVEAANAIGTTVGQICKSLLFIGDEPVLVIASGINRVSLEKVSRRLGYPVKQGSAKQVKAITGFSIGGVPPVGHQTSLRVLIDDDLLNFPEVWAAAGTPHAVFRTTPRELVAITLGEVADVKEEPLQR